MSSSTLSPHDIPEGALIEVRVNEGTFSARFYWAETQRTTGTTARGPERPSTPRRSPRCAMRDAEE